VTDIQAVYATKLDPLPKNVDQLPLESSLNVRSEEQFQEHFLKEHAEFVSTYKLLEQPSNIQKSFINAAKSFLQVFYTQIVLRFPWNEPAIMLADTLQLRKESTRSYLKNFNKLADRFPNIILPTDRTYFSEEIEDLGNNIEATRKVIKHNFK
jgi:hypothetical protein